MVWVSGTVAILYDQGLRTLSTVQTLAHESRDHTVEARSSESESLLSSAQSTLQQKEHVRVIRYQ